MSDIDILGNDVLRDPGLETAVLISLFTDKRAELSEELSDRSDDRRGWWADTSDDKIGSKLWLEHRSGMTDDVPAKLEAHARDSLQWMITDGVMKSMDVSTERISEQEYRITVKLLQPDGQRKFYKYSFNWESEILKRG